MVAQIERGMIEDFKKMLFSFSPQDVLEHPRQIFLQFFELMRDNSDIVSVLVGPNGDLAFINQIKDLVRDKRMTRPGFFKIGSDQNFEYFSRSWYRALSACLRRGSHGIWPSPRKRWL